MTKILLGCPTSAHKSYCLNEYAEGVKALQGSFDVLIVDNSDSGKHLEQVKGVGLPCIKGPFFRGARDRIVASRNLLREKVLNEGYDFLFSLEQDVIPQKDALQKLLSHNKPIVSGVYTKKYILEKNGKEMGRKE